MPKTDPLTAAYIAIGAYGAIAAFRDANGLLPENSGELDLIGEAIIEADALDALGYQHADALGSVVWAYEVAEVYGHRIATSILAGEAPDRAALRASVIEDATHVR